MKRFFNRFDRRMSLNERPPRFFLFEGSTAFICSASQISGRPIMDVHFGFRDMSCGKLVTPILGKTCAANAALGFSCLRPRGRLVRRVNQIFLPF